MEFIQNLGMPQRLLAAALVIGVLALLLLRQRSAQTAPSAGREKAAKKERSPRARGRGKSSEGQAKPKDKRSKGKKDSSGPTSTGRGRRRKRNSSDDVEDTPTPTAAVGRMVPRLPAAGEASDDDPFAGAIGSAQGHDGADGTVRSADGLVAEPGWPSNDGWSNGDLTSHEQSTQVMQSGDTGSSSDASGVEQVPQTDWSDDADDFDPATGWGAEDDAETPAAVDETTESEWTEETADWTVEAGWETVDPAAEAPLETTDDAADWADADEATGAIEEPTWTEDAAADATGEDWHAEGEADLATAWQPVDEEPGEQPEQSFSDWGSADESEEVAQDSGWGETADEVEQIQDFSWDPSEHTDEVHAVIAPLPAEVAGLDGEMPVLPTGGFDESEAASDAASRWGASVGDIAHDAIDAEPVFASSIDGFDMTPEAYVDVATSGDVADLDPALPLHLSPENSEVGLAAAEHSYIQPEVTVDPMPVPVVEESPAEAATVPQSSLSSHEIGEELPAAGLEPTIAQTPLTEIAPEPMVVIEPAVIAAPGTMQVIQDEAVEAREPMVVITQDESVVEHYPVSVAPTDDGAAERPAFNPVAALVGDQNAPVGGSADEPFNDPSLVKSAPVPNPLNRWSELEPASVNAAQDSTLLRSWERMQPSVSRQTRPSTSPATAAVAQPTPAPTTETHSAWWDQPLEPQLPERAEQRGRFALGGFALAPGHHVVSGITFRESVIPPPTSWRLGPIDGPVAPGTLILNVDGCLNCRPEDLEVLLEPGFVPTQDGFSVRLSALQNGPFAASGTFVIQ